MVAQRLAVRCKHMFNHARADIRKTDEREPKLPAQINQISFTNVK